MYEQKRQLAGLLGCLLALPFPAAASEPLYAKNLSPVAGLLGLPSPRAVELATPGGWQFAAHAGIASQFAVDSNSREAVNLDGETWRLAFDLRYGLAEHWELQLELPVLSQDGGSLDGLIDGWHDLWGMPDGGRKDVARDLLDYRYGSASGSFALQDSSGGIGDITLALHRALYRDDSWQLSAGAGYKFASGRERDFLGSGAEDAFVVLRAQRSAPGSRLGWQGQAGYLRAGRSGLLGPAQERDLWFAGVGVAWAWLDSLSLLLQVDSHSAPLDSGLTALGGTALLLTAGARWRFSPDWALDLAFAEDIRVETAPDVTFQASLRYRPR
ncbi:DUF3187 family protein [Haliea sp. E1-2-M8]|uniref:DUF3187 family protein n=1 Tax=Haliea sp. E1-2-M8 TaxID=3064706 RepID=UPI0027253A31|nr:DUF3187 family protein [Haliea sp. E1-2-M8]MDO8861792.1 DUF3187 family protein [Haliea sp. E1-2-M8]